MDKDELEAGEEGILEADTPPEPECGKESGEAQEEAEGQAGEELESLRRELAAEQDKYIRLYADFDNYKKRTAKEKSDIYAYASLPLMEKLLTVLDSFDSALKEGGPAQDDPVYQGLAMVSNNLAEILKAEGLKPIATVGERFDPNLHNGVATDELEETEDDEITEEFIRGYIYKDKVIRPSMVKVNRKS